MPNVLSSWKEIASYVGRSIRTVQRWERELGLPVHRPNGKTDGVVIALPAELDAWVLAMPTQSHYLNAGDGNSNGKSDGNGNSHAQADGNGNGDARRSKAGAGANGGTQRLNRRPVRAVPRPQAQN
jgi:hypothetical protein